MNRIPSSIMVKIKTRPQYLPMPARHLHRSFLSTSLRSHSQKHSHNHNLSITQTPSQLQSQSESQSQAQTHKDKHKDNTVTNSNKNLVDFYDHTTSILIIGSGATGLTASLRTHFHNNNNNNNTQNTQKFHQSTSRYHPQHPHHPSNQPLKPLLIEKTSKIGGSSAWSGGAIWMPNNHLQHASSSKGRRRIKEIKDSLEKGLQYLEGIIEDDCEGASSKERKIAYLKRGPEVLRWLEGVGMGFRATDGYPDYHPQTPGSLPQGGRTLEPLVFNLNQLGHYKTHLNKKPGPPFPPIYTNETSSSTRFLTSFSSFIIFIRILSRWIAHLALGRKPVTMGMSLVAQLLKLNLVSGTEIWRDTSLVELIRDSEGRRVIGAVVDHEGRNLRIRATHGVVLSAGGFAKNIAMRKKYHPAPITTNWTSAAPSDTGDAILAGLKIGAKTALMDEAWWGPTILSSHSSSLEKEDQDISYPYFVLWDRARPFSIIVDSSGRRFMNEAESYVDAVHHQYERHGEDQKKASFTRGGGGGAEEGNSGKGSVKGKVKAIPGWMIMDSKFQHRYPISSIPPLIPPNTALKSGLLISANTIEELARKIEVDEEGLRITIERFNEMAKRGVDEDYDRGGNTYDQYFGDPKVKPNPNLGAIDRAPFYAIKIFPGDLGTKGGLLTDEHARVLGEDGKPIAGLYAAGNTSASVMGRRYPGSGGTLGPAITFAAVAVDHMVESYRGRQ